MTDRRLLALERRFRRSGSPADEAAWLLERVRVGLTTERGLRVASFAGHPAAAAVLAELGQQAPTPVPAIGTWIHSMPGFWVDDYPYLVAICQRVGAALAHLALPCLRRGSPGYEASAHMDRWILAGDERDRVRAVELGDRAAEEVAGPGVAARLLRRGRREALAAHALALALFPARWPTDHINAAPSSAAELLADLFGPDVVRRGVAEDLVPWALGTGDPVRERVARAREVGVLPDEVDRAGA